MHAKKKKLVQWIWTLQGATEAVDFRAIQFSSKLSIETYSADL